MIKKDFVIQNKLGLHARPAAMLVKAANKFESDVFFEKGSERVNAKSIMGVMMLAASKGTKIKILADGDDAEAAISALAELIQGKFGEE